MHGKMELVQEALDGYWEMYPENRITRKHLSKMERLWPKSCEMAYDTSLDTAILFGNIRKYYYPKKVGRVTTKGEKFYALFWHSISSNGNYEYSFSINKWKNPSNLRLDFITEFEDDTAYVHSWHNLSSKERRSMRRMFKSDVVDPVNKIVQELERKGNDKLEKENQ